MDIYIDTKLIAREVAEMVMRYSGQPSAAEWIPCQERLPEVGRTVLATTICEGKRVEVVKYCGAAIWDVVCDDGMHWRRTDSVLAWMPFPEPYEEKE